MKPVSPDRREFIPYPTNRVVGTVRDATKAQEAIDALLRAGFEREDIDILHGEEDLHRLDPTGAGHGFLAQFHRTLIRAFELEEFKRLTHHVADVRAGRFVVMVRTKRRLMRIVAADILHQHGAEYVEYYSRWSHAEVPPTAQTTPEDIPVLFARAWNNRDADALAALFDEDAEFVNVTGLCWHDRESIRKAHAQRLGVFSKSTLAAADTKVKLLAPRVAVVHSQLTLSEQSATGAGPRTTIASFVVHRVGERWLCASVHNTEVAPNPELDVIADNGVAGLASYPAAGPAPGTQ